MGDIRDRLSTPEMRERVSQVIRKERGSSLCAVCDRIMYMGGRCNCKEMADAALACIATALTEE